MNTIDMHCNLFPSRCESFALIEGTPCRTVSYRTVSYRTVLPCSHLFGVITLKLHGLIGHWLVTLTPHSEYLHCLQAKPANLSSICSHVVP